MGSKSSRQMGGSSEDSSAPAPAASGSNPSAPAHSNNARTDGVPVTVNARTVGGTLYTADVSSTDTVAQLKLQLQASSGIQKYQQKLLLAGDMLQDVWVLCEHGIGADAELTLVVGPKVPEWAEEHGLGGDHPALLRSYFDKHGLEAPEWMASDDQIWEKLQQERRSREETKEKMSAWSHFVLLWKDSQPSGLVRAKPGQRLSLEVHGWIHNKNGDSCIHQLVLALDTGIVADLSDGVPGRGRDIKKTVVFQAPKEPGIYMLWRSGDLQYSMRDAHRNFQNRHSQAVKGDKYPGGFVGWVVVEEE